MKTKYTHTVEQMIDLLRSQLDEDISKSSVRIECADILWGGHIEVSNIDEKEFSNWLMEKSVDVDRTGRHDPYNPYLEKHRQKFILKIDEIIVDLEKILKESREMESQSM